jgi:hypothetical protein
VFFLPCIDSDPPGPGSEKGSASFEEFFSFDLDDPLDFLPRECFGMVGWSWIGDSAPRLEVLCRLEVRLLPDDSSLGESIDLFEERWRLELFGASVPLGEFKGEPVLLDAWRLECFDESVLLRSGEFKSELALPDESLELCFGFSVWPVYIKTMQNQQTTSFP